jgi:hypothetical protein
MSVAKLQFCKKYGWDLRFHCWAQRGGLTPLYTAGESVK